MNEIEQTRANMRSRTAPAEAGLHLLVLALVGAAVGFIILWLMKPVLTPPVLTPLQPSASLPTFADVRASVSVGQPPPAYRPNPEILSVPNIAPDYRGKSASEIGKLADAVCFRRAHARYPHWSKTPRLTTKELTDFSPGDMGHFNELLRCLLTEGPMRYCSGSERRMISGEIAMYFRGIEYANRLLDRLRKQLNAIPDVDLSDLQRVRSAHIAVDMTVGTAIETRLRDGLLTKADRDRFIAVVPQNLRDRLVRIDPPKSGCPDEPWWAFWR